MKRHKVRFAVITVFVVSAAGIGLPTLNASAEAGERLQRSPTLRISPSQKPDIKAPYTQNNLRVGGRSVRSIDGSGNHRDDLGAAFKPLVRLVDPEYSDGISELARQYGYPGPREVSNAVNAQEEEESVLNGKLTSDFLWQWGQFLDHDIDLTDAVAEDAPFSAPSDDPYFLGYEFPFNRSRFDDRPEAVPPAPRQQVNEITSYIDASNVYGSDLERALALRTLDGTGRLRITGSEEYDDLLPYNEDNLPNANGPRTDYDNLFLAGDVRANEQILLTAMHTLFVREHNRLAEQYARADPSLTGEEIFQKARRMVGAEMQWITYNEFLPALLGKRALAPYRGYKRKVDPGISNVFATSAFRLGHSMLSSTILRLDENFDEVMDQENQLCDGHLPLRNAFFQPELIKFCGIEPLLRGAATQVHQKIDVLIVSDVRNFLFGAPGSGGFDLASLNIQRGRDHGLPSYNSIRKGFGLPPALTFDDVTSDVRLVDRLASIYGHVDDIDPWIGMLAEDHVKGAQVGDLLYTILVDQFERLRDGDRFWYQRTLKRKELRQLRRLTLGKIIKLNTRITDLPNNVFRVE